MSLAGALLLIAGFTGGYFYWQRVLTAAVAEFYALPVADPETPTPKEARGYGLPLNNPDVVNVREATHMRDDDVVYGVVFNGQARAYPRWIMIGYHIANDTVNGEALLVVQCEVCSSAAAWVPFSDWPPNDPLAFETCGFSGGTFEMCDNFTNSRWHPFSGKAHFGHLKNYQLTKRIPVVIQRWKAWRQAHPDTDVLFASPHLRERKHSHGPDFEIGEAFIPGYMARTANMTDPRLPANALVFGLNDAATQTSLAVPLDKTGKKTLTLELSGRKIFLIHHDEFAVSAFYLTPESGALTVMQWKPLILSNDRGGKWNQFGDVVDNAKAGEKLIAADGYFGEWHEWLSEHPNTKIPGAR